MKNSNSEKINALTNLSSDLTGIVERVGRAILAVCAREPLPSSGVHWRQDVVVTAAHTVRRDEDIILKLPDGESLPATLAGHDSSTDLAVLKFDGTKLPVAEIGNASSLRVGHLVVAVGRGGGAGPTASWGVVSAIGGPWHTRRGGQIDQLVRPDLRLYPGFSGSALSDSQGQVVGINTSGLSRGMSITIPARTVERVVTQLLEKGHIARGFLGVGLHPVRFPQTVKNKLNLSTNGGMIVLSVEPDGPADKAGVLIGDVLVTFDGKSIMDAHDLQTVLAPESVGKTVSSSIVRGGTIFELEITLGERPRR